MSYTKWFGLALGVLVTATSVGACGGDDESPEGSAVKREDGAKEA